MLEIIIAYINSRIASLGHFQELKSLCEILKKDDISFPAEYCTKDEYKQIDFDSYKGLVYHRLTGEVSRSEAAGENSGCETYIVQTYPVRTIFSVPKDILKTDNNFIDIKIAENVVNAITLKNSKILTANLKADVVSIKIKSYSTDREKIWKEEYEGVEMVVNYKDILGAIEYDIVVEGSLSCFNYWGCHDVAADISFCPPIPTPEPCENVTILNGQGQEIDSVEAGGTYVCNLGGGNATVTNSDMSYNSSVSCGGTLVLDDVIYNVNVNGVFNQAATLPAAVNNIINIS